MTRTGSLAYYLAAIVCGSFFFTLAQFLIGRENHGGPPDWAKAFLFAFFLETIFGCVPQVLGALLLRRLAKPLRWTEAWHWAVGGAGLFVLVLITLGIIGAGFNRVANGPWLETLGRFFFGRAMDSLHGGIWQGLAAGGMTALVLYSVQRAFSRSETAQGRRI
jgi:hypothetical protein